MPKGTKRSWLVGILLDVVVNGSTTDETSPTKRHQKGRLMGVGTEARKRPLESLDGLLPMGSEDWALDWTQSAVHQPSSLAISRKFSTSAKGRLV